jgi:acetyltransferase-like isoleucine patch superfamily enzyme
VTVRARRVDIADHVFIGDGTSLIADELIIGHSSIFFPSVRVLTPGRFALGAHGKISEHAILRARSIDIGDEFWMNRHAEIGGGGWRAGDGYLRVGSRCHIGRGSHVNVAAPVELGDDTAIGMDCTLATHAHWQPVTLGYWRKRGPIKLGSDVAIYSRTVIAPEVTIGDGVTIAGGSVVLESMPAGALVGGMPARVLRQSAATMPGPELVPEILASFARNRQLSHQRKPDGSVIVDGTIVYDRGQGMDQLPRAEVILVRDAHSIAGENFLCVFDLAKRELRGKSTDRTEALRNFLFGYGIRFKYFGYERRRLTYEQLVATGIE